MSLAHNPRIVTDGLVLCLDAANPKSYPGSGTTWSDLSGNGNNGGLVNGPSYSTDNKGVFTFDGVNDYWETTNQIVNSPSSLTISGWMMKQNFGSGTYETVLHHGNGTSVGGSSYWFGCEDATNNICATIGAVSGVGWSAGLTNIQAQFNIWYYVAASWDGSVVRVYVNGDYVKQYNLSSYTTQSTPTRVGVTSGGINYMFGGKANGIAINMKGLTESEIKQNFNALKGRYGL
jgi:hypothetical protein